MKSANLLSKRNLLIAAVVVGVLSVSVYAMNIGGFDDYDPPDTIHITWYDYFRDNLKNSMSTGNKVTDWPRWSAEYPYRAFFVGRGFGSSSSTSLTMQYAFVVYSKTASTNLFTFEYIKNDRKYPDSGRIRAKIKETDYVSSEDIAIRYSVVSGSAYDNMFEQVSYWNTFITTGNKDGYGNVVFEFDFYYDCTDKHESNTQLLNMSGVRNISVPYDYILTCGGHGSSGGSSGGGSSSGNSGGGSSSGGSSSGDSSGGSSSGGSSEYPWEDDKNTPDYGGSSSGSSSSSIPDFEGTTGEKGDSWDLPEWSAPDLPWTDDDINIPSMPEMDFPEFPTPDFNFPEIPTPDFNFPEIPDMPDVELPVVPYDPPDSSWPPPFPGTS